MEQHILIEDVSPSIDCGRYPVKRVAGESCVVRATIFRDGHDIIRASVKWRRESARRFADAPMSPINPGLDLWQGEFPLEEVARYVFTVEAWTDRYASWLADLKKRVDAGYEDVRSEVAEGLALIAEAEDLAQGEDRKALEAARRALQAAVANPRQAHAAASSPGLLERMGRLQPRLDAVSHPSKFEVHALPQRARFGAWYELFVRSQGTEPGKSGTFLDAERRLRDIRDMGFDVVYLAPIHPVGTTKRKGRNNTLQAAPDDPGSPWAIGSERGGHTAIEPAIGTIKDFDRFVDAAKGLGMEVALDFAIQASPDHPWVKDHPEWFYRRPDGTIKYAENPPKKYEDIYPVNFDTSDREGLWEELLRTVLFWIGHGVRIFRVDNPHTKPLPFWEWFISKVHEERPDVVFLSEAFTRPPMMKALAKLGFVQSYTYFTWRNTKQELADYLTELTQSEMREFFMPNFFTNTPDILTEYLQKGGRPAFKVRLVLAATLSPSYGIYSGFELLENVPVRPGSEEYLNSEKYEIRVRDWDRPGNIKEFVARVNRIRQENPALHHLTNLKFFPTDNEQILLYGKVMPDCSNVILVAVNLDPLNPHHCTATVPPEEIGVPPGGGYEVCDLLTGARYTWSRDNYVRLVPEVEPAHILRVERRF